MAFALYSLLLTLVAPLVRIRLWWRGRKSPGYQERIPERFGHVVPPGKPVIWVHAVSAGETIAIAPLIARLTEQFAGLDFVVTTMTPTGAAEVVRHLEGKVHHYYAPYDFPWAVDRFFRKMRPLLLILVETELWPGWMRQAKKRGVPVLLVNARLSAASTRGYEKVSALTKPMMASIKEIACQTEDHAKRFQQLGAAKDKVQVLGSVKFDVAAPANLEAVVTQLQQRWQAANRPVWIAASTHSGEEESLLTAHKILLSQHPHALLILVPRHPERCDAVQKLITTQGLGCDRYSDSQHVALPQVVLVDVMGLLTTLYAVADVAFIGGSLNDTGGHNPIEAAVHKLPILMGPSRHNFEDVCQQFEAAAGLATVNNAEELSATLSQLLNDNNRRNAMADNAYTIVEQNRGATIRLENLLTREITAVIAQ